MVGGTRTATRGGTDVRFASVCSGIGAPELAWGRLGWKAAWCSEVDPFASAVLAERFADTPNLGDMTEIGDGKPIDVLVGGTPCQGFSLAGRREGMDDPRSRLSLAYGRIAAAFRARWIVWENVPGVLSSGQGADFAAFLETLAEVGYQCSWRVLDTQFVRTRGFLRALPQRRRRVFLVGHRRWQCAAAVLADLASCRGDPPPRREEGEDVARCLEARAGGVDEKRAYALPGCNGNATGRNAPLVGIYQHASGSCHEHPVANALTGEDQRASARNTTLVRECLSVRRLTPMECERLQGFPDGWTDIPWKRRRAPDTLRYRAVGNAMSVNVMEWLGERIALVEELSRADGPEEER